MRAARNSRSKTASGMSRRVPRGSWDRRERQAAHQKTPERPSRIVPAIEFGLLTVIGMEMAVITLAYLWR